MDAEVEQIQADLKEVIKKFRSLPRRDSFGGLELANKINKLQQRLEELGVKPPGYVAEITIEVPFD